VGGIPFTATRQHIMRHHLPRLAEELRVMVLPHAMMVNQAGWVGWARTSWVMCMGVGVESLR
jgi:hypothetical protein